MKVRKQARRTAEVRCVLCHDHIPSGGVTCPTCDVRFHRACHEGRNGCPTYGCEGQIEDLVLPPSSSSLELVRSLVGGAVLLLVLALIAALALGVYSVLAAQAEVEREREALVREAAARHEAATRARADEARRTQEARERAAQAARDHERQARERYERDAAERRRREAEEREASLRAARAAVEERRRQAELQEREARRVLLLEQGAAEWVRTVVFGELASRGTVQTQHRLTPRAEGFLRAGKWLQGEVVAATARSDGVVEVRVRAPGIDAPCVFEVRHRPDTGFCVVQVR